MATSEWQTPAARMRTRKPDGGQEGTGMVVYWGSGEEECLSQACILEGMEGDMVLDGEEVGIC